MVYCRICVLMHQRGFDHINWLWVSQAWFLVFERKQNCLQPNKTISLGEELRKVELWKCQAVALHLFRYYSWNANHLTPSLKKPKTEVIAYVATHSTTHFSFISVYLDVISGLDDGHDWCLVVDEIWLVTAMLEHLKKCDFIGWNLKS